MMFKCVHILCTVQIKIIFPYSSFHYGENMGDSDEETEIKCFIEIHQMLALFP